MTRRPQGGQVIVIFGLALVAIVAMVALIVEGGNAFAQQRITQNGADAAANAGAVVLAQQLGSPGTKSDADVDAAVDNVAGLNNLVSWTGYYTNVAGAFVSIRWGGRRQQGLGRGRWQWGDPAGRTGRPGGRRRALSEPRSPGSWASPR